jgi:hypothetical protein
LTDDATCGFALNILTISLGSQATVYSTSCINIININIVPNTLQISTVNNPNIPGEYPIAVTFKNGVTTIGRKTLYLEILP